MRLKNEWYVHFIDSYYLYVIQKTHAGWCDKIKTFPFLTFVLLLAHTHIKHFLFVVSTLKPIMECEFIAFDYRIALAIKVLKNFSFFFFAFSIFFYLGLVLNKQKRLVSTCIRRNKTYYRITHVSDVQRWWNFSSLSYLWMMSNFCVDIGECSYANIVSINRKQAFYRYYVS